MKSQRVQDGSIHITGKQASSQKSLSEVARHRGVLLFMSTNTCSKADLEQGTVLLFMSTNSGLFVDMNNVFVDMNKRVCI